MQQQEHRFNVYGRVVSIVRNGAGWDAFLVGADGKRGPLGIEVPEFLAPSELREYLADIYHESATPANGDVIELPGSAG